MQNFKTCIKKLVAPSLLSLAYTTRFIQGAAYLQGIKGAIILMYHSVTDDEFVNWIDPANHVPVHVFAKQMAYLSRNRHVVSMENLIAVLRQGKTPPDGTVTITFDDGYLDNLMVAAPILNQYKFPATLFLSTGYIDRGENQWIDRAFSAFRFRSKSKLAWGAEAAATYDLDNPAQNRAAYQAVCIDLLEAGEEERRTWLSELYARLRPTSSPPRLTLTWDEVRRMVSQYDCFEIGGHTVEHIDLRGSSTEKATEELTGCARRIEEELGVRPRHFSFPYGRTSEPLRRLAAEAGFESACGGDGLDPVIKTAANPFRLPRVPAPASIRHFDLLTCSANTGIWRKLGR